MPNSPSHSYSQSHCLPLSHHAENQQKAVSLRALQKYYKYYHILRESSCVRNHLPNTVFRPFCSCFSRPVELLTEKHRQETNSSFDCRCCATTYHRRATTTHHTTPRYPKTTPSRSIPPGYTHPYQHHTTPHHSIPCNHRTKSNETK